MNDLDFTNSARDELYDAAIALHCFKSFGEPVRLKKDEAFFAENEKSEDLYLLLEGEVRLFRRTRVLDIMRGGEIFGEMAAITGKPRTAWAVALTPCEALRMNPDQFRKALREIPPFALMLIGIMINRTRVTLNLLARHGKLGRHLAVKDNCVFSGDMITDINASLGNKPPLKAPAKTVIMREGDRSGPMYVVRSGRIALFVNNVLIDHIGAGGMIGEIALIDGAARAATAFAETGSNLLVLNRDDCLRMIKSNPRFAVTMLRFVATRLSRMTAKSA